MLRLRAARGACLASAGAVQRADAGYFASSAAYFSTGISHSAAPERRPSWRALGGEGSPRLVGFAACPVVATRCYSTGQPDRGRGGVRKGAVEDDDEEDEEDGAADADGVSRGELMQLEDIEGLSRKKQQCVAQALVGLVARAFVGIMMTPVLNTCAPAPDLCCCSC